MKEGGKRTGGLKKGKEGKNGGGKEEGTKMKN